MFFDFDGLLRGIFVAGIIAGLIICGLVIIIIKLKSSFIMGLSLGIIIGCIVTFLLSKGGE